MNRFSMALSANTFFKAAALTGATIIAVGCGGGSDDDFDDESVRFVGTWSGAMTKISDTCNRQEFPTTFTFSNVITQNESAIELADGTGLRYLGNTVGGDGFSVDTQTQVTISGVGCTQSRRIEYDAVNDDDDNTAETDFNLTEVCPNDLTCEVQYSGTASRAVSSVPTPTVAPGDPTPTVAPGTTPQPTPTQGSVARTGCLAMNPNPASGFFEGNGGCGFSEAKFSFSSTGGTENIVLNPLGSNGLTTFAVNSANTSSASSVRNDLTVKGDVGYGCSVVCSPPGTFTVTCNREGGTQCIEKF